MEWRDGQIVSGSYWQLPYGVNHKISMEEAKEELNHLLAESVREHLLSDVPLGVWLSGGIDSTTILHYATKANPSRLKSFSISFKGRSFDETSYIRTAAREYGTDHAEMDLNPDVELRGAIEEFAYYSDEPSADAGALPVWFLSKLCRETTTVALSGEGADELFGGYLTYRANRIARHLRHLPRPALSMGLSLVGHWPVSDEKIGKEYVVKRLFEGTLMSPARAHVYWNGTFADAERSTLVSERLPDELDETLAQMAVLPKNGDDLAPFLWLDQKYYLADDILTKSDRMSMAHSLEVRSPLLDHRLVEFATSLPARLKLRGWQTKAILRDTVRRYLPASTLRKRKHGFSVPLREWFRGSLHEMVCDYLSARSTLLAPGVFNHVTISRWIAEHHRGERDHSAILWLLLNYAAWKSLYTHASAPSRWRQPTIETRVTASCN